MPSRFRFTNNKMKTVEEEYPDFTKTLPASVRFDQELILVEVPVDVSCGLL